VEEPKSPEEEDKSNSTRERFSKYIETDSVLISKGNSIDKESQAPYGDTVLGFSTIPGVVIK